MFDYHLYVYTVFVYDHSYELDIKLTGNYMNRQNLKEYLFSQDMQRAGIHELSNMQCGLLALARQR